MEQLHTGHPALIEVIRHAIITSKREGISFYDFMRLCLYEKKYGYYMRDNKKIGKDGDFYTSASIGTVMGKMLARFVVKAWASFGKQPITIEEWGGGDGTLAAHMLTELEQQSPEIYETVGWVAIEASDYHMRLQQMKLASHADRIIWMQHPPKERTNQPTIVIANELLDAFPVYRVKNENGKLLESIVKWSEEKGFYEQFVTVFSERLLNILKQKSLQLLPGQITEINVDAPAWFEQLGQRLEQAIVLVIDYGDVEEELYAPHRMTGTLMCYHRHVAHDNPFIHVGEQDMTSLVDFTACMRAAADAGFENMTMRSQKQFLIDEGVLELLKDHHLHDPFSAVAKMNRAVSQLLLGAQMSERFKVLTMEKGQLSH